MGALARALLSPPVVNFVLLPALGAVHGWATNTLAVWLLFRPLTPWRLPLLGWSVQGLLPRRQPDLARSVLPGGTVVVSGLVASGRGAVRSALEAHGLPVIRELRLEDWIALWARRPSAA